MTLAIEYVDQTQIYFWLDLAFTLAWDVTQDAALNQDQKS